MKKHGTKRNSKGEQDYFGLTVKQLEKSISQDPPDSILDRLQYFLSKWGRLLAAIFLVIVLFLACRCALNFNREMSELSKELYFLKTEYAQLNEENNQLQKQLSDALIQNDVILHSIESGDNLSFISEHYYGTDDFAPNLAALNGITLSTQLHIGQIIKVPKNLPASWESKND